jgi:hypothetical protein
MCVCRRDNAVVTPNELRRALTGAQGEAVSTCLAALDELGASDHAYFANDDRVPTSELEAIYRRRASHVEDIALPTLGFREVVQRMAATSHTNLRLAGVEGESGYPKCVVFLAPDEPDVVAVLAVRGRTPPT